MLCVFTVFSHDDMMFLLERRDKHVVEFLLYLCELSNGFSTVEN